jgi:hypothetical protein
MGSMLSLSAILSADDERPVPDSAMDHIRKRRADSPTVPGDAGSADEPACKKAKHEHNSEPHRDDQPIFDGKALLEDMAQELECGCCAAIVYRPVVVMPCQHFFCGRCVHYFE